MRRITFIVNPISGGKDKKNVLAPAFDTFLALNLFFNSEKLTLKKMLIVGLGFLYTS